MNTRDAFNILGISEGEVSIEDIKQAYRRAAQKYHPDRNPTGLEMMQLINAAYDKVKDFSGIVYSQGKNVEYGEHINAALNAIMGLGLTIEICGSWVWVTGNTKPHKDILKAAGFIWSAKKVSWYFRPKGFKSRNHRPWEMEKIRSAYGSNSINDKQNKQNYLATAS